MRRVARLPLEASEALDEAGVVAAFPAAGLRNTLQPFTDSVAVSISDNP